MGNFREDKVLRFWQITCAFSLLLVLAAVELACGGSLHLPPTPVPATQPTFSHVILVVEENHNYSEVVGSSSMPYLNGLISQYALATKYFANGHPSIPDYLMLTTGQMETFDDNFSGTISDDNIVRELVTAGKTWKAYEESLPSRGYLGADSGNYVRRHDPFIFLSDVQQNPSQAANIVPFTQFAADLSSGTLPQYAFIAPDVMNDAHNGTLAQADSWLQTNIAPLLTNAVFQSSGLLIVIFDESENTDLQNGGGHVAAVLVGSQVKKGYQSQTLYQHQSILRLILTSSGVKTLPGLAASAPDMTEFFAGH